MRLLLPAARLVCLLASAIGLSGCASQHRQQELTNNEDFIARYDTIVQGQEQRSVGAIYGPSAAAFLRGDKRARNVGDILTVELVESTTGASSAKNAGKRSGSHGLSLSSPLAAAAGGLLNTVAAVVMPKSTAASVSGSAEDVLKDNKISSEHAFKGEGSLEKSNEMRGFVTVTVERVFPNGNLFITGQKRVETDGGEEFVRLRGIVRPEDIRPDNTTISTRVAQAEIAFVAAGDRYDVARQGWLGRFFNQVDPL